MYNRAVIEQILKENGFNEKEAKLYLAVLELGEASISKLASKTHIKRTTIYSLIDSMKKRGIISVTQKRGIQYLSALSPRVLIDRFKHSAHSAEAMLPVLMEMAYTSPLKPRIRFYEGLDGLKEILREFSYSKEPTMGFTDYGEMPKELDDFIRKQVVPIRRKLKNPVRLITTKNDRNAAVRNEDHLRYSEHRLVDFPKPRNPIEILLFEGSKVAFLSFTQKELFGLIIDSAAIHQTLRNIFELVWAGAEKA